MKRSNPNHQVDQWWQAIRDQGELSKRIDKAAARFPVAQLTNALPSPGRRTGLFAVRGALAAACVASLAFALAWSLDKFAEHQAFSTAVEQSISLWGEKNTWAANLDVSVQAAFFLPSSVKLDSTP
jgi:ferric-dicitrate binding protein FerR (iron transport regulator)